MDFANSDYSSWLDEFLNDMGNIRGVTGGAFDWNGLVAGSSAREGQREMDLVCLWGNVVYGWDRDPADNASDLGTPGRVDLLLAVGVFVHRWH